MARIYTPKLIEVILTLSVPNDPSIMKAMMRVYHQALKFTNQEQSQKIAMRVCKALLYRDFPERLCDLAIHMVQSIMGNNFFKNVSFYHQIASNLKSKVILSFS